MDLCVCSRCAVCIIQPQIFAPGHRSFSTLTVHRDPLFAPSWTQYLGSLRYGQQWFAGLRFVEFSRCCNLAAFQDRRPVCLTPCDWPVRPGLMPHINLSACPHRTNFHPGPNLPPQPSNRLRRAPPEYTDGRALKSQEPSFYRSEILGRADLVAQFTAGTSSPAAIMSVPFVYDNVGTENL